MTTTGRMLLLGAGASYAAGSALGYVELNLVGATGLLLVLLAWLVVARPVHLGAERRLVPVRVTVGQPAEGLLTVTNQAARRSPATLGHEVVGDGRVELAIGSLGTRHAQTVTYPLPTARRAVVSVGPFVVTRGDPLGLVERPTSHGRSTTLYVHPRVHDLGHVPLGRQRDLDGATTDTARGDAVFHALREYVVGDDLRRVHWKATAHTGELMVREHADPARPDTTVVLDDRLEAGLDAEGFDLAVEVVASVAVSARRRGVPLRLLSCTGWAGGPGDPGGTVGTSGTAQTAGTTADRMAGSAGTVAVDETAVLDLLAGAQQHALPGLDLITRRLLAAPGGRVLVVATGPAVRRDLLGWAAAGRRFGQVVVIPVLAAAGGGPASGAGSPTAGRTAGPTAGTDLVPPAPPGVTVLPVRTPDDLVAGWRRL